MKGEQWEDWTEPLGCLLVNATAFLKHTGLVTSWSHFPKGGKLVVAPKLYTRREALAKAFAGYLTGTGWTVSFLTDYVYASNVYEDTMKLVFEYIGENEHQFDLHGDEFAQTDKALLEDFALYISNWTSPYWRSLE